MHKQSGALNVHTKPNTQITGSFISAARSSRWAVLFTDIYHTRADISESFYRKVNGMSENSKQGGEVPKEELNSSLCKLESLQQLHSRVSTWLMWVFGTLWYCSGLRRACRLLCSLVWCGGTSMISKGVACFGLSSGYNQKQNQICLFKPSRQRAELLVLLKWNPVIRFSYQGKWLGKYLWNLKQKLTKKQIKKENFNYFILVT